MSGKEDKNAKKELKKSKRLGQDRHRSLIKDESRVSMLTSTDKKKDKSIRKLAPDAKRLSSIAKARTTKKKMDHGKDPNAGIYITPHNIGAENPLAQMTNMYNQLVAFHLHDDESTFWTFKLNEETTAWEVCQKIEEKLHLKDNFDCFVQLFERSKELYAVDRLVADVEIINDIRKEWEEENKVEKSLFVVRVIRMSKHPTRVQLEGYDAGPKIISFLPDKVISRYLFSAGEPPTQPCRDGFSAVVMFVDIAGFTSFTENLLKEGGDQGIEGLTLHLNDFFQKLIAVIKSHHGDVIQFGGDAILVIWQSPLHKLSTLAAAACFCGVDIQSILADYHTSSGKKLSLYVAIAAGKMENIHVGSPGNWIIVFGGEPVSQLSKIMGFCAPGEIVLSVECFSALRESQNDVKLTRKHSAAGDDKRQRRGFLGMFSGRSGLEEDVPYQLHAVLPTLKKPTGLGISGSGKKLPQAVWGFLRGYLSTVILDNIDSALLGWMDGLRRLAIMFVNLPSLDNFASPSFLQDMQYATEVLQETTKKWDGSINKYIMDDKGTLLLCAFGMPTNSSVGTSYRAIRAAMIITQSLKAKGIACTIGVTTDRTFIGLVGSEQRQEFTIMGDAVNMAARLMKKAEDVLVDAATYHQTSESFEFEELKNMQAKGKAKTFSAYRPLQVLPFKREDLPRPSSLSPPPLPGLGGTLGPSVSTDFIDSEGEGSGSQLAHSDNDLDKSVKKSPKTTSTPPGLNTKATPPAEKKREAKKSKKDGKRQSAGTELIDTIIQKRKGSGGSSIMSSSRGDDTGASPGFSSSPSPPPPLNSSASTSSGTKKGILASPKRKKSFSSSGRPRLPSFSRPSTAHINQQPLTQAESESLPTSTPLSGGDSNPDVNSSRSSKVNRLPAHQPPQSPSPPPPNPLLPPASLPITHGEPLPPMPPHSSRGGNISPSVDRQVSYKVAPEGRQLDALLRSTQSKLNLRTELSFADLYGDDKLMVDLMERVQGMGPMGAVVHAKALLGCGKTLFLRHFEKVIQKSQGIPTFFVDGGVRYDLSGSQDPPSLDKTFGPLLHYAYGGGEGEEGGGKLVENLVKEHGAFACLICSVFGLEAPEGMSAARISDSFDEEENLTHVHSVVASKFNSVCDGPKALLIDNAHLLLENDWRLLVGLKGCCSGLMLAFTSLPSPFTPEVTGHVKTVFDSPNFRSFSLPPLSDSVLMKMIGLRLGVSKVDDKVVGPLLQNSRKNTKELMNLVETVKHLRVVEEVEGRVVPNERMSYSLDSFVQQFNNSLYIDNMDQLSPVLQVTLKAAAVAGDQVSISALQYAHPFALSSRQIQLFLYRLHYAGFVEVQEDEDGSIGNTTSSFVSIRTRKWIYNSVLYAHRQKVHKAFAMYHERMLNEMDDIRKGLDVVANHWSKTKTPRRAITFLLQYGDICLHSFDCNAATEVFDRIIQVSGKKSGSNISGSENTVFFRTLCKEKMAIALGLGGHLTRCLALIKESTPEYVTCSSEKKFDLPWLVLRTFVTQLLPLCSDSRRLLFRGLTPSPLLNSPPCSPPLSPPHSITMSAEEEEGEKGEEREEEGEQGEENGVEDKKMEALRMVVKVFFSSVYKFECGGAKNEIPEEWIPIIDALHEMQDSKLGALVVGVEQAIEKLLHLSKTTKKEGSRRGSADGKEKSTKKDSKSPQSVTPLLMATKRDDDQHLTTGVVEPHQQVEMYADACLAATVLGYTDAAEHFMSLSHRQGNSVYDIYSYGYALVQSAFLTIPRGLWGISLNNLKLGVTLLQQCKRRVDRVVALAQTNIVAMAILQGTLGKALECIEVTLDSVEDEESRLLLYWCRGHVLLMRDEEGGGKGRGEEILAPFLEKPNTHFDYQTQLMWVSLVCKRSWETNYFGRALQSLLDAFRLATKHNALEHCTYLMCFAIVNILEVLFGVMEDPESLAGIQSFIGKENYDLRRITETFLGALWRLSNVYNAFEPRFLYFKGRLSWGTGKDKKALKRFAEGLEIAGKHQLLLDSALLNLAIGERLAVQKERDAALESAKNMLWICGAMGYWQRDKKSVPAPPTTPTSPTTKKEALKKKGKGSKVGSGNMESSLQQVFAAVEKDEEESTKMIHSGNRATLAKQDDIVLIRANDNLSNVFQNEVEGQSYRERLGKSCRLPIPDFSDSGGVGIEGDKKKKKKKGFFGGKSEKKMKRESRMVDDRAAIAVALAESARRRSKAGLNVSVSPPPLISPLPSPSPPIPAPSPTSPSPAFPISGGRIQPLSPNSQMERQAPIGAAFQKPHTSNKKALQKNISSPPAGKIEKGMVGGKDEGEGEGEGEGVGVRVRGRARRPSSALSTSHSKESFSSFEESSPSPPPSPHCSSPPPLPPLPRGYSPSPQPPQQQKQPKPSSLPSSRTEEMIAQLPLPVTIEMSSTIPLAISPPHPHPHPPQPQSQSQQSQITTPPATPPISSPIPIGPPKGHSFSSSDPFRPQSFSPPNSLPPPSQLSSTKSPTFLSPVHLATLPQPLHPSPRVSISATPPSEPPIQPPSPRQSVARNTSAPFTPTHSRSHSQSSTSPSSILRHPRPTKTPISTVGKGGAGGGGGKPQMLTRCLSSTSGSSSSLNQGNVGRPFSPATVNRLTAVNLPTTTLTPTTTFGSFFSLFFFFFFLLQNNFKTQ